MMDLDAKLCWWMMDLDVKFDDGSLEALGRHSSELSHIIAMNNVGLDDSWSIDLLDWLLSDVDSVVDDEQRVGSSKDFII